MLLHTAAHLGQPVSEELLQRPCLWGRSPAPSRTSSSRGFQHANMLVVSRLYAICGLVDVEVSAHVVDALHHHSVTGRSSASQRAAKVVHHHSVTGRSSASQRSAEVVCDGLPSVCVAVMLEEGGYRTSSAMRLRVAFVLWVFTDEGKQQGKRISWFQVWLLVDIDTGRQPDTKNRKEAEEP